MKHVEIDRLDDVIVRAQAPPAQLVLLIGHRGQEHERYAPEPRGECIQPFQHFKSRHDRHVDVAQHEVGHVFENRVETGLSIVGGDRFEALIGKFLDDQRGGLTIVLDAQDFLARFGHRTLPSFDQSDERKPLRSAEEAAINHSMWMAEGEGTALRRRPSAVGLLLRCG